MRRFFATLSLVLLLVSPYAAAQIFAQCGTPVPTWTPSPTYQSIVLGTQSANLIAYFPLNETSGTVADDLSGVSADGTYSGVTLNATTFLNGDPAPSFDGVNDYVNIYSSALNSAFNSAEGSIQAWVQVANTSVWTDTLDKYAVNIANGSSNRARMFKMTLDGRFNNNFVGGGTSRQIQKTGLSDANWHQFILTWSSSGNTVTAYFDGGLINSAAYATWTGALSSTGVTIGANGTSGANPWYGYIAHVAVWSKQLTGTDATALYNVPSAPSPTPTVAPSCTATPPSSYYLEFTTPNGEPARVVREMRVADYPIILLLVGLLVSIWAIYLVRRLRGGR